MKLKSYFAHSIEAAIALARQELGPEAVLVKACKVSDQASGRVGDYEVVIGFPSAQQGISLLEDAVATISENQKEAFATEVLGMRELREEIRQMRRTLWRAGLHATTCAPPFSRKAEILSILAEAEVEPKLASEIAICVEARLTGDPLVDGSSHGQTAFFGESRLVQALREELEGRLPIDPSLGKNGGTPRIAAVVGPCGSGKTTTLVKLAVRCGLQKRLPVQFLCLDTYRIAAAEQLRTYAAILGAGFEVVEPMASLEMALRACRHKGLILIDTPGYGPAEQDLLIETATFLTSKPEIDVHLVLPASMKPADLSEVVDRFEVFRPSKLLFTKLDETCSFGPIFSEAARTGKPVSFLTAGQRIPDDLEEASRNRIVDTVFGERFKAVLTAA